MILPVQGNEKNNITEQLLMGPRESSGVVKAFGDRELRRWGL